MVCEKCHSMDSIDLDGRCEDCGTVNKRLFDLYDGTKISISVLASVVEIAGYTYRQDNPRTLFCKRTDFPGFILSLEDHGSEDHKRMPFDFQLKFMAPSQIRTRDKQLLYQLMMLILEANFNESIFTTLCLDLRFENLMVKSDFVINAKVSVFDFVVFVERSIAETLHFTTKSPIGEYLNINF